MKAISAVALTCLFVLLPGAVVAGPPEGFVALWNGEDFEGWRNKAQGGWVIEDGVIAWREGSGYLWTEESFGDFELELEFKITEGCNSGVFFRTDPRNPVQGGFEIQVLDSHGKDKVGKQDAGSLYDASAPSENAIKPPGEWNHLRLRADGSQVVVHLNGVEVQNLDLDTWSTANQNPDGSKNKFDTALKDLPREGHIGFQDHGGAVWYRNVYIKELGGE
jgi:hypothetical protein